ncbi:hypothetical protein JCM4814A_02330 [Streptomyces phaeofaciens JCM 4814]|uniref:Uncharacterized protein n=1 Tax=Streptomyces phaeofaciens TaxID=68254 RepID=A0A918HQ08_9ACTN|nr:hypothetical protein GCM10010226_83900 [Streptomyces phaeofaciens]
MQYGYTKSYGNIPSQESPRGAVGRGDKHLAQGDLDARLAGPASRSPIAVPGARQVGGDALDGEPQDGRAAATSGEAAGLKALTQGRQPVILKACLRSVQEENL